MHMKYKDASLPVPTRAADLLSRMTLEEKIAQMHAFWLLLSEDGNHKVRSDAFIGHSDQEKLQQMLKNGLGQITRPLGSGAPSSASTTPSLPCGMLTAGLRSTLNSSVLMR